MDFTSVVAIDPDKPVTIVLTAVEALCAGTGMLDQASKLISQCEQPGGCSFCIPTGMELQRIGLLILKAVTDAGDAVPPAHTDN
jgi:hypothetical protein